tara:strand:- start:368 stop:511 length:144 start_codon:yes stop_codon:yes gene_type:complete
MKYYKYKYIDSKNKEHNIYIYASSWKKAQEKFELENKDVKEIIKVCS